MPRPPKYGLPRPITTGAMSTSISSRRPSSRAWLAIVPAATSTSLSPASSWAAAIPAATPPSVTNVNGASGCASTHSVGTEWVTTTTGRSMGCRPPQPSVKSNSVRPTTSAPAAAIERCQNSALCGVTWKVRSGVAVVTSTSPASYQSNSAPIVLSSKAMYPSNDIVADDPTLPMSVSSRGHR